MHLKYLFTAIYTDGSTLVQTQQDVSSKDWQRSAFYDVEHDKLQAFGIESDTDAILVHLDTGDFELNGVRFGSYDKEVTNRRLIYFRRHRHQFSLGMDEIGHDIEYHLGWQGNDPTTGENIQRVLIFT